MAKTRVLMAAALSAMLVGTASIATFAQDASTGPEGQDWQLGEYTADGALVAVPVDVDATLLLENGEASGSGGCNSFFGSYVIDGASISFADEFGRTQMFCEGDAQTVEDAYMATLPTVTSWAVSDGALSLLDADGEVRLLFGSATDAAQSDMELILALLARVESQVGALESRITELEGGNEAGSDGNGATAKKIKKPKAPKARGGKVETTSPDYMRDEFRPESERSDDKNRELVKWNLPSGGGDGVRVYARRGFCTLKSGADPDQELTEKDFTTKTGKALLIAELGGNSKRYRPKHDEINGILPAAADSPYSNDQYYDMLVTAYNEKGESKKTKVASFFLTPEFRCP